MDIAIAGSDDEATGADDILTNVSQRIASQIRDSVEELGHLKRKTGEAAMNEVTTAIRELVDGGSIRYQSTDDEDE